MKFDIVKPQEYDSVVSLKYKVCNDTKEDCDQHLKFLEEKMRFYRVNEIKKKLKEKYL